jgi:hypothetical protein
MDTSTKQEALWSVLLTKYYASDQRRMRWEGHVECMGDRRGAHRVLVRRPKEKSPLGRPTCRWEGNTKMDIQEVG